MAADLTVTIAGVTLKNPVMSASGTFGNGREYEDLIDLTRLGALVTKGVSSVPWEGNPTPRIAETTCSNARWQRKASLIASIRRKSGTVA